MVKPANAADADLSSILAADMYADLGFGPALLNNAVTRDASVVAGHLPAAVPVHLIDVLDGQIPVAKVAD